jgi:hypothetical protein
LPKITPSPDLDGFEFPAADQRISCGRVDLKLLCNVCEREKSGHISILPSMGASGAVIHSLVLFLLLTFR